MTHILLYIYIFSFFEKVKMLCKLQTSFKQFTDKKLLLKELFRFEDGQYAKVEVFYR